MLFNPDAQLQLEETFSKRVIRDIVLADLDKSKEVQGLITYANNLVEQYLGTDHFDAQNIRLAEFKKKNDYKDVVLAIFVAVIPLTYTVELTSLAGKIANSITLNDTRGAVIIAAELIAIVCETDLYDITPARYSHTGTLTVSSNYILSQEAADNISKRMYLPPMISMPNKLEKNTDSALYSDHSDHVILKRHNAHNKYVSLRSLNKFNSVGLSLSTRLLSEWVEEAPDKIDTKEKKAAFAKMAESSQYVYGLLLESGNEFFLTNKYCKRGRTYSQGYHANVQGTDYKKSLIHLSKKEIISLV